MPKKTIAPTKVQIGTKTKVAIAVLSGIIVAAAGFIGGKYSEKVFEPIRKRPLPAVKVGTLQMAIDSQDTPPESLLIAGSLNNLVTKVIFSAKYEDFSVKKLRVKQLQKNGNDEINVVSLECDNSSGITQKWNAPQNLGGFYQFDDIDCHIPMGIDTRINILTDLNYVANGTADNNDIVHFIVDGSNGYEAIGISTGEVKTQNDLGSGNDAVGNKHYVFSSIPDMYFASDTPAGSMPLALNAGIAKLKFGINGNSDIIFPQGNNDGVCDSNEGCLRFDFTTNGATGDAVFRMKKGSGTTMCESTVALSGSSAHWICDFGSSTYGFSPDNIESTFYIELDTIYMNFTDPGDAIQVWLNSAGNGDTQWFVNEAPGPEGPFSHEDILYKDDPHGGALIKY